MKYLLYLLLFCTLCGCDFGEDKMFSKVGGSGGSPPYFTVSPVTVAEGGNAVFSVSFNRSNTETMTVPYATMDGTATAGSDYTATAGTLTFAPGETSKTISVPTIDDAVVESGETFQLAFGSGNGYDTSASAALAVGTITDSDNAKTLHAYSATASEGNSVQFTVTLSEAATFTVTVDYATSDGTATTADSDYTAATGTLTFAPGETSKTVTVSTGTDTHFEDDETFTLTLSGGTNYTASGSVLTATGTIVNDDSEPTVYFSGASAAEGNPVDFTVNLSNRSFETVTVNYATNDGTAGSSDYTPASGTLTFAPGETSKPVSVTTTADSVYEADETFTLTLSDGANYNPTGSVLSGTGTVTNDDSLPTLTIAAASALEGNALSFSVTLSNASYQTITVNYATADNTATTADSDYTSASGTLTFAPGETVKSIGVNSTTDTKYESNETFAVNLSGGSNYSSSGSTLTAAGTITNDDSAPTLAIDSVSAAEGSALTFTITLSALSSQTITVNYATSDNTAKTSDSDYTSASSTLTFNPGDSNKTITVNTTADTNYENDETLTVTLSGGGNYTSAGSTLIGTGTITNDDSKPTVSVADASATEGSAITFTVQLANKSNETVTVDYATSDGTAKTSDSDYTAASGTLSFAPGETSKTLSVSTTADTNLEADETITLTLSGGGNYTSAGSTLTATGTVTNDDSAPTVTIDSTSAAEGDDLTFTVTLANPSYQTVTVDYATSDGTAKTSDSDYTAASGTLTFAAGETSKTVTVTTGADTQYEADETLTVTLSGGGNYTSPGSTLTGTGTINNDDLLPTLSVAAASATEGSTVGFTVTLARASYQTVTVNYAASDGTATQADSDYPASSGTVTFNPGDTSKTVSISTTADTQYEPDETFTLTLSGGANYNPTGSTLTATGTITNDDSVPAISIANALGDEGGNVTFTVTQDRPSAYATTFSYATSNGTAGASDFTSTSGTGTISSGATSVTISVPATEDSLDETDETFTMTISSPSNATISTGSATGTIVDTALLFDFTGGSLPSGTTFSRASSATYVNSSGNIANAATDAPRFDYDPATLALRGLLLEPAATNLVTYSDQFNNADWSRSGLGGISANSADSASPDGVNTNAEFVRENNSFTSHLISQSISTAVTAGSVVHFTVYAKNDGGNPVNYLKLKVSSGANEIHGNFDLTGGNSPTSGSGGNGGDQLVATMEDAGNGWKRLRVSGVATTSGTSLTVGIYFQNSFGGGENYFGDGSSGANLWGAQLEAGNSVPTSYIPTTSAAMSRSADLLTSTDFTGFSGNFGDGTKWTSIVDFSRPFYEPSSSSASPAAFTLCDSGGCDAGQISSIYDASTTKMGAQSVVSGSVQGGSYSGAFTPSANTVYQLGSVKSSSALTAYLSGSAYTASGTLSFPTVDTLYLGRNFGGHLRKFTLRARAVPSTQMQNLTSD